MGYYIVLSPPNADCMPNYKGLYRYEPIPRSLHPFEPIPVENENERFLLLWQQSAENADKNWGMTTELTLEELKEFADIATHELGEEYELIYFSETFECPHPSEYYGIDVVGWRYSMLARNIFPDAVGEKHFQRNNLYKRFAKANQDFRPKLNAHGLFSVMEDAKDFLALLNELHELSPGCIEDENWRIAYIFKIL